MELFVIYSDYSKSTDLEILREKDIEFEILKQKGIGFSVGIPEDITVLDNKIILFRSYISDLQHLKSKVKSLILDGEIESKLFFNEVFPMVIEYWFLNKTLKPFLKRKINVLDFNELIEMKELNNIEYPIFVKNLTNNETKFGKWYEIIHTHNEFNDLFGYMGSSNLFKDLLCSEVLNINQDIIKSNNKYSKKNKEWRVWVANNKISSISRYRDYNSAEETEIIPNELLELINDLVDECKDLNVPAYCVDFCEFTNDNGYIDYALIEFNSIESSGRYEDNDFSKFIDDLMRK